MAAREPGLTQNFEPALKTPSSSEVMDSKNRVCVAFDFEIKSIGSKEKRCTTQKHDRREKRFL